jgi:hypothetical protein
MHVISNINEKFIINEGNRMLVPLGNKELDVPLQSKLSYYRTLLSLVQLEFI